MVTVEAKPAGPWRKRIGRLAVLLLVLGLVAYYLYFTALAQPRLLQELGTSYSFGEIVKLIVLIVGKSTLFALVIGFVALAAFFTSIPSSGGFAVSLSQRVAGLFFVNIIITWALVILILFGLRVLPEALLSMLVLYIPLVILSLATFGISIADPSYEDLVNPRQGSLVGIIETFFIRRILPANLLFVVVLGEFAYFVNNDPSLPLLAWILLGYALAGCVLLFAQAEGYAFQVTNAKYVEVIPVRGESFRGFVVSRGSDHYLIRTENRIFLLQSSAVSEITIIPKPRR